VQRFGSLNTYFRITFTSCETVNIQLIRNYDVLHANKNATEPITYIVQYVTPSEEYPTYGKAWLLVNIQHIILMPIFGS